MVWRGSSSRMRLGTRMTTLEFVSQFWCQTLIFFFFLIFFTSQPSTAEIDVLGDHSCCCSGSPTRPSRRRYPKETVHHGLDDSKLERGHRSLWDSRFYDPRPTKDCQRNRAKLRIVIHFNGVSSPSTDQKVLLFQATQYQSSSSTRSVSLITDWLLSW